MSPYEVAGEGHAYLSQIVDQHDLCTACLKIVSRQQDYVENIKVLMHQKNSFDPKRIEKITPALILRIMERAGETESEEFSVLCRNTLVALCGGLESLIKDVVAAIFLEKPEHLRKFEGRSLRFPVSSIVLGTGEERARLFVDELYRDEGVKHGQAHRFLRLLGYVDREWDMKPVGEVNGDLDEAYEVRNAIVHRGGKIDQRLATKVSGFAAQVGSPIKMNEERFHRYRGAILKFAGQTQMFDL